MSSRTLESRAILWAILWLIVPGLAAVSNRSSLAADKTQASRKSEYDWAPKPIALPASGPTEFSDDKPQDVTAGARWAGVGAKVRAICFSLSNDVALVALEDGAIHELDPKNGQSVRHWGGDHPQPPVAMQITLDDKQVVLQYPNDLTLYVHNLPDGALKRQLPARKASTTTFAVAPDPKYLAVGYSDGVVVVWNLQTGKQVNESSPRLPARPITAIAFSNDCSQLYVADAKEPSIQMLGLPSFGVTGALTRTFGIPRKLACSFTGNYLFVLCDNKYYETFLLRAVAGFNAKPLTVLGGTGLRQGDLNNCFFNQEKSLVCSYYGGTSMEYRFCQNSPPALAGGTISEVKDVVEVGLSRNGKLGATAYQDGSVQFYAFPPPAKPISMRRGEMASRLRSLLKEEKYGEVDELANEMLDHAALDVEGYAPPESLVYALSAPAVKRKEGYTTHLEALQKWLDAQPQSRAARLVLAEATKDYAWALRGSNIAARTPREAMVAFGDELLKAEKLLKEADEMGSPSAGISSSRITVSMGLGKPQEELVEIWQRGMKQAPAYGPLHANFALALLPRWGGQPGDVARFAAQARQDMPNEDGALAYAVMAKTFLRYESPINAIGEGFAPTELESAARSMIAAYPESMQTWNFATLVACLRQDSETAAARFAILGNALDSQVWRPALVFERHRKWSQATRVPRESDSSFLASWINLLQVAFAAEGMELLTLGSDPGRQIRLWDATTQTVKQEFPFPQELSPMYVSDDSRFLACMMPVGRRVVVLDRLNRKVLAWPEAKLPARGRIAADSREAALFGNDGSVAIFDLENPDKEAARKFKVDGALTYVEFPYQREPWCLVGVNSHNEIRVLSDEGKDLFPPTKVDAIVNRLRAVPNSSKVLCGGGGPLAVMDAATGKYSVLEDAKPDPDAPRHRTALATSRDGKLAAVAIAQSATEERKPFPLEIWDLEKGVKLRTLAGHEGLVLTLSFSGDGRYLASGDELGFVQLWRLK